MWLINIGLVKDLAVLNPNRINLVFAIFKQSLLALNHSDNEVRSSLTLLYRESSLLPDKYMVVSSAYRMFAML